MRWPGFGCLGERHANGAMSGVSKGTSHAVIEGKHFRQPDRLGMFRKSKEALEPVRRS